MCVSSKKAPTYRSYYYTVTFKIKKNPQGSYKFLKLRLIVSFADDVCLRVIVSSSSSDVKIIFLLNLNEKASFFVRSNSKHLLMLTILPDK